MLLRPFLNDASSCASYLFGCTTHAQARRRRSARRPRRRLPRGRGRDRRADRGGVRDARAGRPRLRPAGARRAHRRDRLPAGRRRRRVRARRARRRRRRRAREHARDGDRDAGSRARPPRLRGRRPASRHRRAVARVQRRLAADRRRRPPRPARRRRRARAGARSCTRACSGCSSCPTTSSLYPSHYGGSVCGRGLSGNPFSSIGFERRHNPLLALPDADAFADALLADMPPPPADQERIVAANRAGHGRRRAHDASVALGLRANAAPVRAARRR